MRITQSLIWLLLILFSSAFSLAQGADRLDVEDAFKKLNVSKIPTQELCTKKPMPLPKKVNTIKLWASWCGPCLESMKETWKTDKNTIWINVDREEGVLKSCEFLRTNVITIPIYHDYSENIRKQIGTNLALPMRLEIKNNKVVSTKLGYSHDFSKPQIPDLNPPGFH